MNPDPNILQFVAPYGERLQTVQSPRYFWDNARRGDDRFVILQWTKSGRGFFAMGGREWEVGPEQAFLAIVPEESAYGYPRDGREPWQFQWVNFYGPLAVQLCAGFREIFGPVVDLPQRSAAWLAFTRLIEQTKRGRRVDPHDASVNSYSFLMEWTRQLGSPQTSEQDAVERIMRVCQARFREPLGIKELAAEAGVTREHLTRLFASRIGISPARYLKELRTNAALAMLREQNLPLQETALRCGFPSPRALKRALSGRPDELDPEPDAWLRKARAGRLRALREKRQRSRWRGSSGRRSPR